MRGAVVINYLFCYKIMNQKRFFLLLPSVMVGVLAIVSIVSASTTIGTDVVTAGNIYATSSMAVDGAVIAPSFDAITGTLTLGGTNANKVVIGSASANVGIGTTTPNNKLDLNGNLYTSGTSYFGGAMTATSTVTVTKSVKAADLYASSTLEVDGAITGLSTLSVTGAITGLSTANITNSVKAANLYASSTVEIDGAITASSAATTTIKALSTHATRGFCLQFNATSTNTLLNMTFLASTTAPTNGSGVIPTVNYGACN